MFQQKQTSHPHFEKKNTLHDIVPCIPLSQPRIRRNQVPAYLQIKLKAASRRASKSPTVHLKNWRFTTASPCCWVGREFLEGDCFFLENRRKLIDLFEMISVIIRYYTTLHIRSTKCFQHAFKTVVLCWFPEFGVLVPRADSWSHHLKEGVVPLGSGNVP